MTSHADNLNETDPRFPSCEWAGFYLQRSAGTGRFKMELNLTFRGGRVHGEGIDCVGDFIVVGTYGLDSGEVLLKKGYRRAHDLVYRGFAEATGRGIWGTWEIPHLDRGGFHIWPRSRGEGAATALHAEADEPAGASIGD